MSKIVHMTTVHTADDIRIRRKECATLAEAGFDVVLLAPADENHNCSGVKVLGLGSERGRLHRMTSGLVRALIAALRERATVSFSRSRVNCGRDGSESPWEARSVRRSRGCSTIDSAQTVDSIRVAADC